MDNLILFGESSLRSAVVEFSEHYYQEHYHQRLDNQIIKPQFCEFPEIGTARTRSRLGGMLRYYYRDAA